MLQLPTIKLSIPPILTDLLRARAAATGVTAQQIYLTEMAKLLPKPKLMKVVMQDAQTSPMKIDSELLTLSVPQSKKRSILEIIKQEEEESSKKKKVEQPLKSFSLMNESFQKLDLSAKKEVREKSPDLS